MIRYHLQAPQELCLYERSYQVNTFKFLFEIRTQASKSPILLDLTSIKYLTAAASVMLFAMVNTVQLTKDNAKHIICRFPREKYNPDGHMYVVKTGLSKALQSGTFEQIERLTETEAYYQSSVNPYKHFVHTTRVLANQIGISQSSEQWIKISSAISEAMLNVGYHAYKNPLSTDPEIAPSHRWLVDSIGERWWQCAWYNRQNSMLVFIIFDAGIGIPSSFRGKDHDESLMSAKHLEKALELGESRYKGQGRGNGSEDMKAAVGSRGSSIETLLVYSGDAEYRYRASEAQPVARALYKDIGGTLIEWSLQVHEDDKHDN